MKLPATRAEAIAALWGLAEATFFFIVPDVWLSAMACTSIRRGLRLCLFALAGALAGGALLYGLALDHAAAIRDLQLALPAITPDVMADADQLIARHGWGMGMITGALSGVPYKLFAVKASADGLPLALFLAISLPARLLRFVLVTVVIGGLAHILKHWLTLRQCHLLLALGWVVFYAWFFTVMSQ